jgi:predicted lactoylglutathione lyase
MVTNIFVNVSVKDLSKAMEFWKKLGFSFNPDFTDKTAAALVLGKNIFAMLLTEETLKRFTKKEIVDAKKETESITALSVESREKVDELVQKAVEAGGRIYRDTEDHGWMYGRSFEDLDGHQWELFYMDISKRK